MSNFTYAFDNGRHQVVNPSGDVIAYGETKADACNIAVALNDLKYIHRDSGAIAQLS